MKPPTTRAICRVCGDTRRVHPERGPIPDTCSACIRRAGRADDDEDEGSRTDLYGGPGGEWVNDHSISRWVPNEASA